MTCASKRPKSGPVTGILAASLHTFLGTKSMTKRAHTTPPPDGQLPSFDGAFYNRARAELSKVAELTVPPRDARVKPLLVMWVGL
jgi:hypothetical protein